MGLTNQSTGAGAVDRGCKITPFDTVVAIAGNPNVGKSTVFNALTGMNQHTGNWPGKTVTNARGVCTTDARRYLLVDIPGTYSLMAHSAEEEVARNFLCFGDAEATIVVCDATCLERNLNLVLQTMEVADRVLVCVNLLDEAKRKGIQINLKALSDSLGVPVVGTVAQKKKSLTALTDTLDRLVEEEPQPKYQVVYDPAVEEAIGMVETAVAPWRQQLPGRWLSLQLLDPDPVLLAELQNELGVDVTEIPEVRTALKKAQDYLAEFGIDGPGLKDRVVGALVRSAEQIARRAVSYQKESYDRLDRRIDRILTHRVLAYPLMLLLLAGVFWLTIVGANGPSRLLSEGLFWIQDQLTALFTFLHAPDWLHGALVLGVYRVLAWVVSVMLPPMAIFFPLFTLLEDAGFLPRIAYNLDKPFHRCHACGKQALTMCMGFGCNAAGITGCRIIDSPRERLIAILTNNFVPCNGRFPTLIAVITMFFVGVGGNSLLSAGVLTGVILLGIGMTFLVSRILSATLLKGEASSFTLELPPYRKPQIGKVLVRSIFDRTLFVLGRAAAVAAPAGLIIWLMANVTLGDVSLLNHAADFLDPFARILGLDGMILIAFILGFPANEIVLPIVMMGYLAQGSLMELGSLTEMQTLLVAHGWTWHTAVCVLLFSLFHWPCSTALWTVKKETGSWGWTALAAVLPTMIGMVLCFLFTMIRSLL